MLNCGAHRCQQLCHRGQCQPCSRSPSLVKTCPCGQTPLAKLLELGYSERQSCSDPIPSCGKTCSKPLACGSSGKLHSWMYYKSEIPYGGTLVFPSGHSRYSSKKPNRSKFFPLTAIQNWSLGSCELHKHDGKLRWELYLQVCFFLSAQLPVSLVCFLPQRKKSLCFAHVISCLSR